jgi:DNA-binding MarR family transcriptional regulator
MSGEPIPAIQLEPQFEAGWPGADRRSTECVLNLAFLVSQMTTFGEVLVHRHDVPSVAAFNVLTILHGAGEPLPPSVIAGRMVVSRPTMTGIIRSLGQRGLIRTEPHPTDHRMQLVEITARGRDCVERLRPELHLAEKRWMDCLTPDEQEQLLRLIARLQANAQTA